MNSAAAAITLLDSTSAQQYVWLAFLGSGAAAFAYAVDASCRRMDDRARLALAGAALSACLSARTGIIMMFDTSAFSSYGFWGIGSVANRGPGILLDVLPCLAVTVLCGAATAAVCPISFVGLAVPHPLRLTVGVEQRLLLGLSVLVGPSLLLVAGIVGRVVEPSAALEAKIFTALIGAPCSSRCCSH